MHVIVVGLLAIEEGEVTGRADSVSKISLSFIVTLKKSTNLSLEVYSFEESIVA